MEELRVDMRKRSSEELAVYAKHEELVFRLNHTMPRTPEYLQLLQELFEGRFGEGSFLRAPIAGAAFDKMVIGKGVFIDHGMGVVIGETTVIGDNCTIYQNVTLGGTGKETGKRHPTLGNNVLVGSGAKVLGPFKVGDNARIAAGAVVLSEVPPNSTAVGVPARIVKVNGVRSEMLDQIHISDPVAQALCRLEQRIDTLQNEIKELKSKE